MSSGKVAENAPSRSSASRAALVSSGLPARTLGNAETRSDREIRRTG